VKAFEFRLDQALRWRSTQVDIEKSHAAQAAARLAAIRAELEARRTELREAPRHLSAGSNGASLESFGVWTNRIRRHIADLEKKAKEAAAALAARMELLLEANRKRRLLENLRQTEHGRWRVESNRELEAFAGEAFLGRLQSKNGRARSSGG